MKKPFFNSGNSTTHETPLIVKDGDTVIRGYSVEECRELAKIAKDVRKPSSKRIKFGNVEISGDTIASIFGLCCIGGLAYYVYVKITKSSVVEKVNPLKPDENILPSYNPKPETLNETILNHSHSNHKKKNLAGGIVRRNGINVLVSNTGNGKSILSDQIGIETASCFPTKLVDNAYSPSYPIDTLLFDAELEDDDIAERYGKFGYHYPENFKRIANCWYDNEDELLNYLENDVLSINSEKFYIFDNLSSLLPSLNGGRIRLFFKRLKTLKKKAYERSVNITFLIVVHTIKDCSRMLSLKDIAGSANISNYVDRVIALLPTKHDERTKVIIALKARDVIKGEAIVVTLIDEPYLHFVYKGRTDVNNTVSTETINQMNEILSEGEGIDPSTSHAPVMHAQKEKSLNVPSEIVKEMAEWYQKGVSGHGLQSTIKEFEKKYQIKEKFGLQHSQQLSRIFEYYGYNF